MNIIKKKEALLETIKKAYKIGLMAGTSGNASFYDGDEKKMIISPSSVEYELMTIDDMVVMRLDGEVIEGHREPSSEWKMHAQVYIERNDISAVIHTHSPYATGFAVCNEEIPVILIEMVPFLGGDVKVAKFGMPGSTDLGSKALQVLGKRKSCLLANHGTLSVGETLQKAYMSAIYLEDAAKIYNLAKNSGEVKIIPDEIIEAMRNN